MKVVLYEIRLGIKTKNFTLVKLTVCNDEKRRYVAILDYVSNEKTVANSMSFKL